MQAKRPFNKILVPTDLSETSLTVLPIVHSMTLDSPAEIHVVSVNVSSIAVAHAVGSGVPNTMQNDSNEETLQKLKDLIGDSLALSNVHLAVVEANEAFEGIIEYADKNNIDLIVMTTHGYSGLTRVLLGSVAESVIRKAECSVVTFRQ